MKKCLLNKENLFLMDNWKAHVLYLNFENWADNLKKISTRVSQTMKSQFNDIKISEIKDKKLLTFINFDTEITSSEEKNYLKLFMKQILDFKDVLEKNNQQILSKFGYGLILKLLNFLLIYEKFGFFKFDINGEIDIEKMSQNINKMDKEKMKKEIVYFLKTFLEKV